MFETFEPRVLLSATPLAPPILLASDTAPAIVQDADGTQLSVGVNGAAHWTLTQQGPTSPLLTVTNTTATTTVTLSTTGGDGRFSLGGIDIEGAAQSVAAATTDLSGALVTKGAVTSLSLGDVKDTTATFGGVIGTLSVKSWQTAGGANEIDGVGISSLQSQGALDVSMNLTGAGMSGLVLGTVSAKSAVDSGLWHVGGRAGVVSAASVGATWTGDFTGAVNQISTTGDFSGTLATPALQFLIVGGNFSQATLYIGADLGADGKLGGAGANADTFKSGVLAHIRVTGSVIGTHAYVGVDPVNGVFDDGNDIISGGTASQIQEIAIGGTMDAASRIETGSLPATARLNGATISPASSPASFTSNPADVVAPTLAAGLANDTGVSPTDRLTSDPSVAGNVSDLGGVASVKAGLDAAALASYTALTVNADGSFTVSAAAMTQLAGGTLADGAHTLHLLATDRAGNATSLDLGFTLDKTGPSVAAALLNDTGTSATDGVTQDDTIQGQISDPSGVVTLTAALDGGTAAAVTRDPSGSFTLTPSTLAQLAGGTVGDGVHTLHLVGTDTAGNARSLDLSFTLDTATTTPTFDLAPGFDTGVLGDYITSSATVTLAGTAEPNATVVLVGSGQTMSADGSGAFRFDNVSLTAGANSFTVQAIDAAGNTGSFQLTITLVQDTTAPTILAALVSDTGANTGDGITSNPAVTGTVRDEAGGSGLASFKGGLDATPAGQFIDLITMVGSTGSFTISAALMNTLAGGALSDGPHTLHLIAADARGNTSALDLAFTLDTSAPSQPVFDLSASSDTGTLGDQMTASDPVTLFGTTEPNASVTLVEAGLTTSAGSTGGFSFTNVTLTTGANSFIVRATDAAGNTSTYQRVITLAAVSGGDTTAPALSTALADDTGVSNSDRLTSNPAVSGTVRDEAGGNGLASFKGGLDSTSAAQLTDLLATVAADGSFTLDGAALNALAGGTLADGPHTLHLVASDESGNTSALDFAFTIDTSAPAQPVFDLAASSDTGTLGDHTTASNPVTLSGTTEPNASVTLLESGLTASADSTGGFSFTNVSLVTGTNSFTVRATDAAGNTSTYQRVITLAAATVVDTTAPTISVGLANDTGVSNSDRLTNNQAVIGTVRDEAGGSGLASFKGGLDSTPAALFTDILATVAADGSFTLASAALNALAGGSLADGPHTLHLVAADARGNTTTLDFAFTLDTTAPVQPAFDLAISFDTGTLGDHTTVSNPVTLSGTTEPNASVTLVEANLSTSANSAGTFSFTNVSLAMGANSFTARATDAAGNTSTYQRVITLAAATSGDTVAPTLSVALANDTGASTSDGITSDPSVTGAVADENGGSGLASFKGGLDTSLATQFTDLLATVAANGSFTLNAAAMNALAGGTLADGPHTLHLIATDRAGNRTSTDLSFTLSTATPTITSVGLAQSSDTGVIGDGITASGVVNLAGIATAGATVSLNGTSVLVGAGGTFQLPGVALAQGLNSLLLTITSAAGVSSLATVLITRQGVPTTDVATTWNQQVLNTISGLAMYPPDASRLLAIVSLAQYDTLAAIEGTPAYLVKALVNGPVSDQAALAETAHEVLVTLFPVRKASYDAALATSLQGIADGAAKTAGLALGKSIADTIIALRQNDGSADFVQYDGGSQPGQWSPTAPTYQPAIDPQWGAVTPFAIASADALLQQIGGPPALSSAQWAADLNQVESLGSSTSTTRTADQTQTALFWAGGTGTITPAGIWNLIAQIAAEAQGASLSANVRMFAILNTALADTSIADWDAKYTFGTWRPIEAIPVADTVNSSATAVAGWTPLLITPAFPEYVSGHSSYSAAGATVLASLFGDKTAFSFSVDYLPGVKRSYTSFSEAAAEAGMSRIYGGIHFMFSNTAGQALGVLVGDAVLARFALSQDTVPPTVIAATTLAFTNANLTLSGQVIDNLSGVAGATVQIDSGTAKPLALDSAGNFSVTTAFRTTGQDDGSHTIKIVATDTAGNVAQTFTRSFTLDTQAPLLTLTSLADGATLTAASRLTGTFDGVGNTITALAYTIDNGVKYPITYDPAASAFDVALPIANLGIGQHTLRLTAQDAAGNLTTITRTLTVETLAAFTVSGLKPTDGSTEIGVTYRPRVDFSRAVNAATLTTSSFYATDASGNVVAATIAAAQDGSYAYLMFKTQLPGSSTITLHVVGSAIRAASDGAFLDAAGTGDAAGSTQTVAFTTVSTTGVSGTIIKGIVADPGPDLTPMTFDDIGRGPDGLLNTADDVYKRPIANAKVTILGFGVTVYTDANGYFEIDNAPVGDVKLAVDGRTATNAPDGYFFPEMVMDLTIQPGVVNTPMSAMGSTAEMAANVGVLGTYLPRVANSIFTAVSDTMPTVVTTNSAASPNLTPDQVSRLSLTIQPGSALDANGNPLSNVQVGISTVPPQIVQDMLPPGVMQHTYDITIQAPGVSVFTVPATLTFPNVFNAAPGTKLDVLSYDHTTGRLVIDGTATVSADGLTVTSDPGMGVTAPGWHGLAPPGGCGGSGGPPPPPPPVDPSEHVNENTPILLSLLTGDQPGSNFGTMSWSSPRSNPDVPPLPPIPGCDVPQHVNGDQQPFESVTVDIDGALSQFANPIAGGIPLTSYAFTLSPGSTSTPIKFGFTPKSYSEMFTPGQSSVNPLNGLDEDRLYGAKITITDIVQDSKGNRTRTVSTYYVYRFVDALDDVDNDRTISFPLTTSSVTRSEYLDVIGDGACDPTVNVSGAGYSYALGTISCTAQPFSQTPGSLTFTDPYGHSFSLKVDQPSVPKEVWFMDYTSFDNVLKTMAAAGGYVYTDPLTSQSVTLPMNAGLLTYISSESNRADLFKSIAGDDTSGSTGIFAAGGLNDGIKYGPGGLSITFDSIAPGFSLDNQGRYVPDANGGATLSGGVGLGGATNSLTSSDIDINGLLDLYKNESKYNDHQIEFKASQLINKQSGGSILFHLDNFFFLNFLDPLNVTPSKGEMVNAFAMNVDHEIGHYLGLYHNGDQQNVYFGSANEIMRQGLYTSGAQRFITTLSAAKVGLHIGYTADDVKNMLQYFKDRDTAKKANPGWKANAVDEANSYLDTSVDTAPGPSSFDFGTNLSIYSSDASEPLTALDFGAAQSDGSSIGQQTQTFTLVNLGGTDEQIESVAFAGSGFALSKPLAGASIAAGRALAVHVVFQPTHFGSYNDQLIITTTSGGTQRLTLSGSVVDSEPSIAAQVLDNNFGGVSVGSQAYIARAFTIANTGAAPLTISSVQIFEGQTEFKLVGVPDDITSHPIVLNQGETRVFGAKFDAAALGLARARVMITTNDASNPTLSMSLVGTGVAVVPSAHWGSDYVAIDFPDLAKAQPLRAVSDDQGGFSFFLPPNERYNLTIFDSVTSLVAHSSGVTGPSGVGTDLTATLVFRASTAPDSNGDGLPDDIKFAIGASLVKADSNGDGIDDYTALKLGLNPVAGVGFPTGIVSAASLTGAAQAVAVTSSATDPSKLTAVVATGSAGIALVNVSNPAKPSVLSQLDLTGINVSLAADPLTGYAVVAGSGAGLHIVNVSTPTAPALVSDVPFADPVIAVAASDGVAYVAEGTRADSVDLATGTVIATLDLGTTGGTTLTGLALSGTTLLTIDASHLVRAVTISGQVLTARGFLALTAGSGKITIGGAVAYVPAASGTASGGYVTVDISDLDHLKLIQNVQGNSIADAAMALNGSGLAVGIQSLTQGPPTPGLFNDLDVINVADPTKTGQFVTRIKLPAQPYDVAIANGLAFVADGTGGLQIVNYIGLDTQGVAPKASIDVTATDVDPATPGVQVVEGSVVQINPTITDDVQVRNVQLLVNGAVVANDPSYPFNFSVQAPTIASGGKTMTVQVQATDTGGNTSLSNLVTLNVVKDTFPPVLVSTSIAENASLFFVRSVQLTFNKPLDTSKLATTGIHLAGAGADGKFGTADDVTVPVTFTTRSFGQVVTILLSEPLGAGQFKLTVDPAILADLSGNVATAAVVRDFTVRPASDVKAATGIPAITQEPSANAGQVIGITVPFAPATAHMVFGIIDSNGNKSTADIAATRYDTTTSTAYFLVPTRAITGDVTVYSLVGTAKNNFADGSFPLQIVPVVTALGVNSVASDGSSAVVGLGGSGFVEDNGSAYQFGSSIVLDGSVSSGPDVSDYNYVTSTSAQNGYVTLTVPLSAGASGAVRVTTAGGTSAPFSIGLTGVTATALSGTPADASVASANPGQAVTLNGAGLSTTTGVIFSYTDNSGTARSVLLQPTAAAIDGTSATLVIPTNANGVVTLTVLGASVRPKLQIVPVLSGYTVSGSSITLVGGGFVEGASTYTLGGASIPDTSVTTGPSVTYGYNAQGQYVENASATISSTAYGLGAARVTTAGGTSAALTLNVFSPNQGTLGDVAVDPASGQVWVSDPSNPTKLDLVDPTTGTITRSFSLTSAFGTTYSYGLSGLQVLTSAMTLGTASVPAGSLLVFNGYASPDRVVAINPTTSAVLATLTLAKEYDLSAGTYDPTSGHLFVIDRRASTTRVVELNPATGAEISSFALPFNGSYAGLVVDPAGGTLWYGSDQSGTAVQLSRTGTVLRTISLTTQGMPANTTTGLSFDNAGNLIAASTNGQIYRISLAADPAVTAPTLTQVAAQASSGTPANAAVSSANAGQVIQLRGTNFGANTEVQFAIRDSTGTTSTVAVAPLVVSADGTILQVQVPTLASTGSVRVANIGGTNLGFGGSDDGIYRRVTLQFTAGGTSSALTFADAGLQGVNSQSWGLDNVRIGQGGTTLFSDDFESGSASAQWSQNVVDTSTPGVFGDFLGRISSGSDTLTVGGLVAGQSYTLTFDLYVLDNWLGATTNNGGPTTFRVSADGTVLLNAAFANGALTNVQTYNTSAALTLQVVPTLTGLTGTQGGDASFDLIGSGFMDGATTVTIGGVSLADLYANQTAFGVTGSSNADLRVTAPLTLEGPITVTTAGGSAQIAGPVFAAQPPLLFSAIQATAQSGTPADASKASANTGQAITLVGQGFTSNTLVQFTAEDATGATGTLTRSGTASSDGTTLTLQVPVLSRTGLVRVLGSTAAYQLQVVPVLRAVGGTVASGNTIELEGTGLVPAELVIQVDGRGVGSFSVQNVTPNVSTATGYINGQQLLTLTVPAGIGAGVITVGTAGGSAVSRRGVTFSAASLAPGADVKDTLALAQAVTLPVDSAVTVSGTVGDNGSRAGPDADLYRMTLAAGDQLSIGLNSNSYSHLRLFDATGKELFTQSVSPGATGTATTYTAPSGGTYYVGVSSYYNTSYDPNKAATPGGGDAYTGPYTLTLGRLGAGDTRLSAITATASAGIPTQSGVASANTGQTITLVGSGLTSTDQVVFTAIDSNGYLSAETVTPVAVAANGLSLTVVVPDDAATGTVRLAREPAGVLLQVVPTLTKVAAADGSAFNGGSVTLVGSGFAEGASTVRFGAKSLADTSRSTGLDVTSYGAYISNYTSKANGFINLTAPDGVPTGPISVTTPGGTSTIYPLGVTGITAAASSGTAANAGLASANPGQAITITGTGLDTTTDVVFQTIDSNGRSGQVVVLLKTVAANGTSGTVVVPANAITGYVRVIGDQNATETLLQIVPVVTALGVNSVASDGSSAVVGLGGSGFVEDNGSAYQFGSSIVLDGSVSSGPDVSDYNYVTSTSAQNGYVTLTVPLSAGASGAVRVTTAGGTSAPFSIGLTGVTATALSGTPADASVASANPGQAVTLNGAGLSTTTGVIFSYTDNSGTARSVLLQPTAAAIDGTSATLVIPTNANGVVTLTVLGASVRPKLQIVPVLSGYTVSGSSITLVGGGLVEGASTYTLGGASIPDTSVTTGPSVTYGYNAQGQYVENASATISSTAYGLGAARVTTAGGTSAALTLNVFSPNQGTLGDVAVDPATGQVWVSDPSNPTKLDLVDPTTGTITRSFSLTSAFGTTYSYYLTGLQVLPSAMTLGTASVPAGSLLVFNGYASPDRVVAINPITSAVLASLTLAKDYDLAAGTYDPTSGHLFVIDRRTSTTRVVELNPATAAEISSFALPFNSSSYAGLVIDPAGGTLWYGSDQSGTAVQLSRTGTVLRTISLTTQGMPANTTTGLSFDTAGNLIAASNNGQIFRIKV